MHSDGFLLPASWANCNELPHITPVTGLVSHWQDEASLYLEFVHFSPTGPAILCYFLVNRIQNQNKLSKTDTSGGAYFLPTDTNKRA